MNLERSQIGPKLIMVEFSSKGGLKFSGSLKFRKRLLFLFLEYLFIITSSLYVMTS